MFWWRYGQINHHSQHIMTSLKSAEIEDDGFATLWEQIVICLRKNEFHNQFSPILELLYLFDPTPPQRG